MIGLQDSVVELLREGEDFSLYRSRQQGAAGSVLMLVPVQAHESATSTRRLENEHSLASDLDPAWAVRPLGIGQHDGKRALILEDCAGASLQRLIGTPAGPGRFLQLAIPLATAVRNIHKIGLVHKDIKPAHVIVAGDGSVRLTGFGFASTSSRDHPSPPSPEAIAGTLAYMAPEQTGRMK